MIMLIFKFFFKCKFFFYHVAYSHVQLSVVEKILHGVFAGELVHDLRSVGDHTCRGVYRINSARDVGVLDTREVRKLSGPNLAGNL